VLRGRAVPLEVPITETNRIHLVLFGLQNRTCGPYLAAINRILIPRCDVDSAFEKSGRAHGAVAGTNTDTSLGPLLRQSDMRSPWSTVQKDRQTYVPLGPLLRQSDMRSPWSTVQNDRQTDVPLGPLPRLLKVKCMLCCSASCSLCTRPTDARPFRVQGLGAGTSRHKQAPRLKKTGADCLLKTGTSRP
jgi:hypothetical protein